MDGYVAGYYVYLPRIHVAQALGLAHADSDPGMKDIPREMRATRTVLDFGKRQILIRLRED